MDRFRRSLFRIYIIETLQLVCTPVRTVGAEEVLRHTTMQPFSDRDTRAGSKFLSAGPSGEGKCIIIGGATMAKKVEGYIKLQIPAGKATPAPPVGPALGQHGVNIVEFTKQFNARTADKGDVIIPVVITVYADRSFSFVTKTPPAAVLLKKACNIKSGSATPNKAKVATISKAKLQEIAEMKMPDLNAASLEAAMSMIAGTARSMGITVEE